MSIELAPLGNKCNLTCQNYCYQNPMRDAGNEQPAGAYDLDAMMRAAEAAGVGQPDGRGGIIGWSGFGGEFLLTPLDDLRRLFAWSARKGAPIGLQTNGTLITDRHLDLFQQYRASVGVSMDGPEDLNAERTAKDSSATARTTAQTQRNLERLLARGISTSLIVTLHATNAGSEARVQRLIAWLLDLRDRGLRYVNLHLLEPHGPSVVSLTQAQQIQALRTLRAALVGFTQVSPFDDMRAKLTQGAAHCTFNFCSPYATTAVTGIDGQGQRARCGRLNNDGVAWERSDVVSKERYLALYLLPKERGGCGGCRFFLACGGGNCPGESVGGDWRRKTLHCETLTALFEDLETDVFRAGQEPISLSLRRPLLEHQALSRFTRLTPGDAPHGDAPHADIPHGDSHGDHTDTSPVPAA